MPIDRSATLRVSPEDARGLRNDPGHPSVQVLAHGSMEVRWFRPQTEVQHLPHDRDELYFVVSGTATFRRGHTAGPFEDGAVALDGPEESAVRAGDVLFVPAGAEHEFAETSADFAVWAVFYGPEGGERE